MLPYRQLRKKTWLVDIEGRFAAVQAGRARSYSPQQLTPTCISDPKAYFPCTFHNLQPLLADVTLPSGDFFPTCVFGLKALDENQLECELAVLLRCRGGKWRFSGHKSKAPGQLAGSFIYIINFFICLYGEPFTSNPISLASAITSSYSD